MNSKKTAIIYGIVMGIFGLPIVSVYALNGFESTENSFDISAISIMDTTPLSSTDEFVMFLSKIDAYLMSFFADLRQNVFGFIWIILI